MIKPIIQEDILFPFLIWERGINIFQRKGRVLLIGGEKDLKETLVFSEAIYQCQIGKFTITAPEASKKILEQVIPKEIIYPMPPTSSLEEIKNIAPRYDLLVAGISSSRGEETKKFLNKIAKLDFPFLLIEQEIIREKPTIYFFDLSDREYPLIEVEKLADKYRQTILAVIQNGSITINKNQAVITQFNPKEVKIILAGLASAIWSFNIDKPFESACTASYLTKVWQKEHLKIQEINKVIKKVELSMERGVK